MRRATPSSRNHSGIPRHEGCSSFVVGRLKRVSVIKLTLEEILIMKRIILSAGALFGLIFTAQSLYATVSSCVGCTCFNPATGNQWPIIRDVPDNENPSTYCPGLIGTSCGGENCPNCKVQNCRPDSGGNGCSSVQMLQDYSVISQVDSVLESNSKISAKSASALQSQKQSSIDRIDRCSSQVQAFEAFQ